VIPRDGAGPFGGGPEISPETQRLLDEEVRRIVTKAHEEVIELLKENRPRLDGLVHALLEHETLDEEDAYAAAGVERTEAPTSDTLTAAARTRTT
jgi:cell division protease FtsH